MSADNSTPYSASTALRIAIVGGSISGCMAAVLLGRSGHTVDVFERSSNDLQGRGGGIATSASVVRSLKSQNLVGPDFPTVHHRFLRLAVKTPEENESGRCVWGPELDMECVHWSGLFQELRGRVDDCRYHLGKELISVTRVNGMSTLQFSDNTTQVADLVVYTDGFRSLGRQLMHPQVELDYRGFAVWRGTLDENKYNVGTALDDHPRLSFVSMPGSFITYLMPSDSGLVTPGKRVINWAAYLPVSEDDLGQYMIDRSGQLRQGTVPAGQFPIERELQLKALMREQLPSIYADVVAASIDTQFQPIRITRVPAHFANRSCLVGDAAVTIQPMTGAGAFKAYENARTLVNALAQSGDLDKRLQSWSVSQTDLGERLLATGLAMEKAFIWHTIDLATATASEVENWWQESIRYPPEYSYLKQ